MLTLLLVLLNPPPVVDVPPVRAGSVWIPKKSDPPPVVAEPAWKAEYRDLERQVSGGAEVWVSVGVDYPGAERNDGFEGVIGRKGVFKFYRLDGKNLMAELVVVQQQPAVTPRPLFNLIRPRSGSS